MNSGKEGSNLTPGNTQTKQAGVNLNFIWKIQFINTFSNYPPIAWVVSFDKQGSELY